MTPEQFKALKVGQHVYDKRFHTYGTLCEGDWRNDGMFRVITGSGLYIHWDDGDHSKVGIELINESEISHFELYDGPLT